MRTKANRKTNHSVMGIRISLKKSMQTVMVVGILLPLLMAFSGCSAPISSMNPFVSPTSAGAAATTAQTTDPYASYAAKIKATTAPISTTQEPATVAPTTLRVTTKSPTTQKATTVATTKRATTTTTAPKSGTVYRTDSGSKFHRSTCNYLSKSKIPISRADAIAMGLTPCSVCKP